MQTAEEVTSTLTSALTELLNFPEQLAFLNSESNRVKAEAVLIAVELEVREAIRFLELGDVAESAESELTLILKGFRDMFAAGGTMLRASTHTNEAKAALFDAFVVDLDAKLATVTQVTGGTQTEVAAQA